MPSVFKSCSFEKEWHFDIQISRNVFNSYARNEFDTFDQCSTAKKINDIYRLKGSINH